MERGERAERLFWVTGWIYDFSKVATTLLIVGLVTHYFLFTVLIVRGQSMVPNYVDGEVLTVNKISYLVGSPQRGDVVAMFFPGETEKRFIKRIVGLPGERVTVSNGHMLINGQVLKEAYLPKNLATIPDSDRTLQTGEYFAMGDNRSVSSDSRAWGPVPQSFIIGKVTHRLVQFGSSQTALGDERTAHLAN